MSVTSVLLVSRHMIHRSSVLFSKSSFSATATAASAFTGGRASLTLTSTVNRCTLRNAFTCSRRRSSPLLIIRRHNSAGSKFQSMRIATQLRAMDKVPNHYELIYRIGFNYTMVCIQVINLSVLIGIGFTLLTALLGKAAGHDVEENHKSTMAELSESTAKENEKVEEAKVISSSVSPSLEETGNDVEKMPVPRPIEMLEGDISQAELGLIFVSVAIIMVTLLRLQRMVPIRIYTSTSRHCYAVFYGHVIPSRTTKREFVAGTVKKKPNQSSLFASESVFVDGTGRTLVLLDYYFRRPKDFNFLLGISKRLHDDDNGDGEYEKDHSKEVKKSTSNHPTGGKLKRN